MVFTLIPLALFASLEPEPASLGPEPASFALVVGSNRGGPGQRQLRFAHEDARRIRDALVDVGRYDPGRVSVLLDPSSAALEAQLDEAEAALRARGGGPSLFLFYYSGHARASGLSLGPEELPLDRLRARLEALPATVKLVLLDACQSGEFSRVKGAVPVEDFSYHSMRLESAGLAVLASSSGSELSQESDRLQASYFTHHLVTALRGAGDVDDDGKVTLAEAHRYAYHQTLLSTAETQIGGQHVSYETKLKGKGEVTLSYPAAASSQLALPAELSGGVVVSRRGSGVVMAEIEKSPGVPIQLALPPGPYAVLLRGKGRARRCELDLAEGQVVTLDPARCSATTPPVTLAKGSAADPVAPERFVETWSLEMWLGGGSLVDDDFTHRLEQFGYSRRALLLGPFDFGVRVGRSFGEHFSLHLGFERLEMGEYRLGITRGDTEEVRQFSYSVDGLGLAGRVRYGLLDDWIVPYVEAGGGLAWAMSSLGDVGETQVGYHIGLSGGIMVMFWKHLGVFAELRYRHAPVLENLLGDVHDSGGFSSGVGIRGAL